MTDKAQELARLTKAIADEKDAKRQAMADFNDNIKRLQADAMRLAQEIQDV